MKQDLREALPKVRNPPSFTLRKEKQRRLRETGPRGRFHKKSQFETSFGLSLGLKSETFVSAEFLAQMDFTKGGSAETGLKS